MEISKVENIDIIEELWRVIRDRKVSPREGSYTNKLLCDPDKILEKLQEELGEMEEAIRKGKIRGTGKDSLVWEASDLIYHLLVLLAAKGVELDDVLKELKRRR